MKITKLLALHLALTAFILAGCSGDGVPWQGTPTAFGDRNQVIVVSDKSLWESPVADTVDYYFAAPYLVLPQPEPILDLMHFTTEEVSADPIKKQLKAYILVADMNDENSPTTRLVKSDIGPEKLREAKETTGYGTNVGRNKWAKGQLLIYIYGYGRDKLIENIQNNAASILERIQKEEDVRIDATAYMGGENEGLQNEIYNLFGIRIKLPSEYQKAIYDEDDQFIWVRKDTRDANSNIFIQKIKYTDKAQLSRDTIKAIRNRLGHYASTSIPNTYMKINDVDLPMFVKPVEIDGNYALEARGIWDMENDYAGGPFISYLIHNPKKNELIFIDGFVHAPGEEKRDHMQELEYIITHVKM
ncbi:MAG: DUF4837 family protein [Bacteroidetes bacterium]|nr:MAG: DUF4837 family protein [Bacteroidota bacterium]